MSIKARDVTGSVQKDCWSGRVTKLGLKGTVVNFRVHVSIIEKLPKYKNLSRDEKEDESQKMNVRQSDVIKGGMAVS